MISSCDSCHLSLAVFSTVALGRMDVALVARNVGVQDPAVIGKAREYMRLASVRLSGGLGQVRAHVLAVLLSQLDLASRSSSASTSTHTRTLLYREKCARPPCAWNLRAHGRFTCVRFPWRQGTAQHAHSLLHNRLLALLEKCFPVRLSPPRSISLLS